ncbi:uncharacterized protein LOC128233977 [Mya arenaria]|uniref:uncharacterized protein LOC128233977 n=1 Tax=Mya arenaria TaxID=6604 RepID=UPI0022E72B68|nr:uncharacterized protein LOC128233977 [Mya arenaria]
MSKTVRVLTPRQSKTPPSKSPHPVKHGSRAGLPPAPQLMTVRYVIDVDVIKCPTCLDVFKSPRVLPCGHSFCLECLESSVLYTESSKSKDYFQCPVCRKNVKPYDQKALRQKWAYQFPLNVTVMRFLRNASTKNPTDNGLHKAFCEICLVNNRTKTSYSYCNVCLQHLCEMCHKYHVMQDDTKDHDLTFYGSKDDQVEKCDAVPKSDWSKKSNSERDQKSAANDKDKRLKTEPRDKLLPIGTVVVAQTVTAADSVEQKIVSKLGGFNGKSPADSGNADFRAVAFLSNTKLALADLGNKKLKVFDVSHKTRVELIGELALRANPYHMCRVDENTVAIATERSNNYHIRLFTVRDKICHFVHRSVEGIPLGIGFLQNTLVCSFLENAALQKFRLTRAQQTKAGMIKSDRSGNDIFRHPGSICAGVWRGIPVLYVADETEFGVTVTAVDIRGDKKTSVFFEMPVPLARLAMKSANGVAKMSRGKNRSIKATKKENTSPNDTISPKCSRPSSRQPAGQLKEKSSTVQVSGRHTFRRIDDFGSTPPEKKIGREIERTPIPYACKNELVLDLNRLRDADNEEEMNTTIAKSDCRKTGRGNLKAVERASRSRPVGKVLPQPSSGTNTEKGSHSESTANPNSTLTSTSGTAGYTLPQKFIFNADSIDVDIYGNVYVCMSKTNTVHQMSPDGKIKREILTEKDGILSPKVACFSPKSDFFVVTCMKSNRVLMYRLKH